MLISLIAGMAENRVIGNKGMIPWKRMAADMKHLRQLAAGKAIVMGSETARSMVRYKSPLLAESRVFVLTRGTGEEFEGTGMRVAHSLEEAVETARADGEQELCILGGGQLYAEAIDKGMVDRMHLTLIHASVEGDTSFPALLPAEWHEVSRESHPEDEKNPHPYTFMVYDRKKA